MTLSGTKMTIIEHEAMIKRKFLYIIRIVLKKIGIYLTFFYLRLPVRIRLSLKSRINKFPNMKKLLLGIQITQTVKVSSLIESEARLKSQILRNLVQ
jgi:hypothetical protein